MLDFLERCFTLLHFISKLFFRFISLNIYKKLIIVALFVENNRSLCNTVLWGQSTTLVPNTANRGSDVGKMSPKLMTMGEGWGGGGLPCALYRFITI